LLTTDPKSGRAVSAKGAGDWADRLLPLPPGLAGSGELTPEALVQGLRLTGFFLDRGLRPVLQDRPLPEARPRLRHAAAAGGHAGRRLAAIQATVRR